MNRSLNEESSVSYECPFKEFKDTELGPEYWGKGPDAVIGPPTKDTKESKDKPLLDLWVDEHRQPVPRSVRRCVTKWVRAQQVAANNWGADVVVFDDSDGGGMNIKDVQMSYSDVIQRSAFTRSVLSVCFMLERVEGFTVEHQWESFNFSVGSEGWRAKHHIYSPGMNPGGGPQHKPTCSKNGCYLVRLFYLGTWRCIWVDDLVPVDSMGNPLLAFAVVNKPPAAAGVKRVTITATGRNTVQLWPLLLSKALLKLAAPEEDIDEGLSTEMEDEHMPLLNIMHALTGGLILTLPINDPVLIWKAIIAEVPMYVWDNRDDDKSKYDCKSAKGGKKPVKEATTKSKATTSLKICDTRHKSPYEAPGMAPGYEMDLIIFMARDVPLEKPPPEPEIPNWKRVRWVEWARKHGLYAQYECPRTQYLKCTGLLKLSYKPELLDMCSVQTIKENTRFEKKVRRGMRSDTLSYGPEALCQEDNKDWIPFNWMTTFVKSVSFCYYPSALESTSVGRNPPKRIQIPNKPFNRAVNITAPKYEPLYLQVHGQKNMNLWLSLNVLHPRILLNCNLPIEESKDESYLILEEIAWFKNSELPKPKGLINTISYDAVQLSLQPGRYFFRLWIHSLLNWHTMILSDSAVLLGTRDLIMETSSQDCDWTEDFLWQIGSAFSYWIKFSRSSTNIAAVDREFYNSYKSDLPWHRDTVGYPQPFVHWMFRRALEFHLRKKMSTDNFRSACLTFRRYFRDPVFGLPNVVIDPLEMCMNLKRNMYNFPEPELCNGTIVSVEDNTDTDVFTKKDSVSFASDFTNGLMKSYEAMIDVRERAVTTIQSYWRGTWTRKMLNSNSSFTLDIIKLLLDTTFGQLSALSELMMEFFKIFPRAKSAYTIATALRSTYIQKYTGLSTIMPKSKWVPFFQDVFFCHAPIKVHIDLHSNLQQRIVVIYDNDTKTLVSQSFNAHRSFEISPNLRGYTIMGHAWIDYENVYYKNPEVQWQLTILTSVENVFHICENENMEPSCRPLQLQSASRFTLSELFIPNRNNILGSVHVTISRKEYLVFHAVATSADLEMLAKLSTVNEKGETTIVAECSGTGEIYWPYLSLEPATTQKTSISMLSIVQPRASSTPIREDSLSPPIIPSFTEAEREINASARSIRSTRSLRGSKILSSKNKLTTKARQAAALLETKLYTIEITAPNGWPLTLGQWRKVEKVRNASAGSPNKKGPTPAQSMNELSLKDAFVELELSLSLRGGAVARRDGTRDVAFMETRRSWDAEKTGRNEIGAQVRSEFHSEHRIEASSTHSFAFEAEGDFFEDTTSSRKKSVSTVKSSTVEMGEEFDEMEGQKYFTMPEPLKDKFYPLDFVQLCRKEEPGESIVITSEMAEMAKRARHEEIENAQKRMVELEEFNKKHNIGRQKKRARLVSKLFVDAELPPEIIDALDLRQTAILAESNGAGDGNNKK